MELSALEREQVTNLLEAQLAELDTRLKWEFTAQVEIYMSSHKLSTDLQFLAVIKVFQAFKRSNDYLKASVRREQHQVLVAQLLAAETDPLLVRTYIRDRIKALVQHNTTIAEVIDTEFLSDKDTTGLKKAFDYHPIVAAWLLSQVQGNSDLRIQNVMVKFWASDTYHQLGKRAPSPEALVTILIRKGLLPGDIDRAACVEKLRTDFC
ncbi:hypothetical protein KA517_04970 [Candidatus Gracilibacteria bacterium]|nr:hypothetical protein [Candidatus Gracilibacteria bacterium]